MGPSFDRHVRILIIGAGAIGCSLAYHLTRRGVRDVLVLEKSQITNGCTWHAAGLVGQLRGRKNLTRLMQNSVAVFDRLVEESGQQIDWKKVGSIRLASSKDRWSEIRRSMTLAKSFGFECHSLSPAEAKEKFPFISLDGVVGAALGIAKPQDVMIARAEVEDRLALDPLLLEVVAEVDVAGTLLLVEAPGGVPVVEHGVHFLAGQTFSFSRASSVASAPCRRIVTL